MEGARTVVIEDLEIMREVARVNLEACGHSVVAEAASLSAAYNVVSQLASGDIEADVILLDGNLRENTDTYQDARDIFDFIKEQGIDLPVLGFSLGSLIKHGIPVTRDVGKRPQNVVDAIAEL